jgi:hypothetical protein
MTVSGNSDKELEEAWEGYLALLRQELTYLGDLEMTYAIFSAGFYAGRIK